MIKNALLLIVLFSFCCCKHPKNKNSEGKMQQHKEYKDLHEHQGTENYEVITLCKNDFVLKEKLIEKKQNLISLLSENENDISRQKVNFFGNVLGNEEYWYRTLKDGTLWTGKHYLNWLLNEDDTKQKYINPLTYDEKRDVKSWLKKFSEFYNKASYVYESSWSYYMKVEDKWYKFSYDKKLFTHKMFDTKVYEKYPTKINPDEIHMLPLQESMEDLMKAKTLKIVNYIEQDSESGVGLNPISFSAGYYMLELHLPQGDTLKFRRYGAMGVSSEMFIYQIPKELGGSNEVFFIEQEPNEMYPNKSFAGFYVIRPKNYKELTEYKTYFEQEQEN